MLWSEQERPLRPVLLIGYADNLSASRCARHFRRLGWEVHLAADANDARRLATRLVPHLTVLDAELPQEGGWACCARLTREDTRLRVVLLTGEVQQADRERASAVGAAGLVRRDDAPEALAGLVYERHFAEAV